MQLNWVGSIILNNIILGWDLLSRPFSFLIKKARKLNLLWFNLRSYWHTIFSALLRTAKAQGTIPLETTNKKSKSKKIRFRLFVAHHKGLASFEPPAK